MIVQIVNIGNIGANHFDILIPGGGVGVMQQGCPTQFPGKDLGATNGGFGITCNYDANCIRQKCEAAFSGDMLKGCLWYADWFGASDNPNVKFGKVDCPQALRDRSGM